MFGSAFITLLDMFTFDEGEMPTYVIQRSHRVQWYLLDVLHKQNTVTTFKRTTCLFLLQNW